MSARLPYGLSSQFLLVLAVTAVVLLGHHETVGEMMAIWNRSDTYAHGWLILPACLWLVWTKRIELAAADSRISWLGLAGVLGFSLCWLLSDSISLSATKHLSVAGVLICAIWAVIGTSAARVILFALAFLLFAVPIGEEFLLPVLMRWTADFTVGALRLSGIPVYRDGLQFILPSGKWSVIQACSGIRYLIASLMVGSLYAYLNYRSLRRRLLFMAVALVVPIVANWLRAYIIVMLGHFSDNRIATGVDHLIYGWAFFGVVILAMFVIGARWREDLDEIATVDTGSRGSLHQSWIGAFAVVALLSLALPAGRSMLLPLGEVPQVALAPLAASNGWADSTTPIAWRPQYSGFRAERMQFFTKGSRWVGVYVAYYAAQKQGEKMISWDNVLAPIEESDWHVVAQGGDSLSGGRVARRSELAGPNARAMVWQWYWMGGDFLISDYVAKLKLAMKRLMREPDDSAVIMLFTASTEDLAADKAIVDQFWQDNRGALDALLTSARGR